MKIAMIAPFAFAPKATVNARTFPMAQALAARGHDVVLLVPPYDNLDDAGHVLVRDGVSIHNLPIERVTALTPLVAGHKLAALAHAQRPDIVHVFKPIGYAAVAGMVLHLTSRIPLVTDSDDWESTGGWNSINPYPWHWKRFFDFQERWLPRRSGAVTVASRTLETQMWGMGIPPDRVFYVPNCPGPAFVERHARVSASDAARIREALGIGSAPMAIYVGHISLGDDLDLALEAFAQVLHRLPAARLVIVGAGDGLPRLRDIAAHAQLGEAVILTGWVDHAAVPAYLAAADAAIYPYRDSLVNRAKCSIKVLEYMTAGKAIVTHRVGQNTEYLENGRSAILAEPGDVGAFADGLHAVLTDRAYAAQLGQEAAQRIRRWFTWDRRIGDVEEAYRRARAR